MSQGENAHIPVLLQPILENLPTSSNDLVFFDGTFGGAGYSSKFLNNSLEVYACDLDQTALDKGELRIENFNDNKDSLHLKQSNFADYIETFQDEFFDGIVLDLGFSSNQLEYSNRGFAYKNTEEILDLRYDISKDTPGWKQIEKIKKWEELGKIIYNYSGDNFSGKIARNILDKVHRGQEMKTVGQFVEAIKEAIPKKFQNKTNSTLSRVWQSLRIWINREFESLETFLPVAIKKLKKSGQLYIVCFHSLEEKIVTQFMRKKAKPYYVDDYGNQEQDYKLITRKPIKPTELEVENNIRSRSATLRILKRIK